jgi:hypothetical protein
MTVGMERILRDAKGANVAFHGGGANPRFVKKMPETFRSEPGES